MTRLAERHELRAVERVERQRVFEPTHRLQNVGDAGCEMRDLGCHVTSL